MKFFADSFSTCFGPFSVALHPSGAIAATAFGDLAALGKRLSSDEFTLDHSAARQVREQVLAFSAGERTDFNLELEAHGTPFQRRVWSALQKIPVGETRTYGLLAASLGNPAASRAVGRANATNPICLLIPCHRVIGSDGSLTGFAFGEAIKRQLLNHERALVSKSKAA